MSGRYNWDGSSHQRLYDEIHGNAGFFGTDGAGVSGAHGAQDGWAELAALMARAYWRTEAALAKAGAEWEGGAADAMRSGVTPLSQWAVDAHDASAASAHSTETHVLSYSAAKNTMPEPVKVTSTANSDGLGIPAMYTHLLGGQTDQDKQEAAAQEAKAEAVRIMSGYEAESGFAQAGVGQFVPPPSVTVAVAPPTPTGGDGIPVGGSEPPPTGPERGDGTASFPRDTPGGTGGPGATPPPSVGSSAPPGTGTSSAPAATTTPSFTTTPPPCDESGHDRAHARPTPGYVACRATQWVQHRRRARRACCRWRWRAWTRRRWRPGSRARCGRWPAWRARCGRWWHGQRARRRARRRRRRRCRCRCPWRQRHGHGSGWRPLRW